MDTSRRAALMLGLAAPSLTIEAFAGEPEAKPRNSTTIQTERIAQALENLAKEVRNNGVGVIRLNLSSDVNVRSQLDEHTLTVEFFLHPERA